MSTRTVSHGMSEAQTERLVMAAEEGAETAEADRDRLAKRVAKLEVALKPFAEAADAYDPDDGDDGFAAWATKFRIGQLRAARRTLEESHE